MSYIKVNPALGYLSFCPTAWKAPRQVSLSSLLCPILGRPLPPWAGPCCTLVLSGHTNLFHLGQLEQLLRHYSAWQLMCKALGSKVSSHIKVSCTFLAVKSIRVGTFNKRRPGQTGLPIGQLRCSETHCRNDSKYKELQPASKPVSDQKQWQCTA